MVPPSSATVVAGPPAGISADGADAELPTEVPQDYSTPGDGQSDKPAPRPDLGSMSVALVAGSNTLTGMPPRNQVPVMGPGHANTGMLGPGPGSAMGHMPSTHHLGPVGPTYPMNAGMPPMPMGMRMGMAPMTMRLRSFRNPKS